MFQIVDVDSVETKGSEGHAAKPLIRLYGVTDQQESIRLHVHNFYPYFFFPVVR